MINISVVIPVYNASQYIERCAKSLFEQSLEKMEFIFINDCSTDDSISILNQILRQYPKRKEQTRIIKMPSNSGQAAARRRGMMEARGEYVIHCDADDWVDRDLYLTMYENAIRYDADIVVCDEIWEYANCSVLRQEVDLLSSCKEVVLNWYKNVIGMYCHNKLVRRSLYLDNNVYPWNGLNMWEDNGLMTRLFYYGDRLAQVRGCYYHYNKANDGSITAAYGNRQVEQMIAVAEGLTAFFNDKDDKNDFIKTVKAFQFLAKINLVSTSWKSLRRFYQLFPESDSIMSELDWKAFSLKGRLRFCFVRCRMPWLFVFFFKIANFFKH